MGKGSSRAPDPPDPAATAQAQAAANKEAVLESARVNQFRQITPYGTLEYTGEIGEPSRTRTTTLAPSQQQQLEQQNQLAEALGGFALGRSEQIPQTQFSLEDLPGVRQDFSDDARRVEQATYDRTVNLLEPQFERQERRLETNLANRGIPIGGEAYGDVRDQFETGRDEALLSAANAAVQAGRGEQSRLYGLESADRARALNERLLERSQPINELAAILQGSPATGTPQFGTAAQYQISPGDVQGATNLAYQGQLNQFNQANANRQAGLGGLFQLGSAALPFFF